MTETNLNTVLMVPMVEFVGKLLNDISCEHELDNSSEGETCEHQFNDFGHEFKMNMAKTEEALKNMGRISDALQVAKIIIQKRVANAFVLYTAVRTLAAYHLVRSRAYRSPRCSSVSISTNGGDDSGDSDPDQSDPPLLPYLYQSITPKLHLNSLPLAVAVTCSRQMSRYPSEGGQAA